MSEGWQKFVFTHLHSQELDKLFDLCKFQLVEVDTREENYDKLTSQNLIDYISLKSKTGFVL